MLKNRGKKVLLVAVFLVSVLFLPLPVQNQASSDENVLRIGSHVPLIFKEGVEIKRWHEVFAKMVNEKGGLSVGGKKYLVEFHDYDVGYMDSTKTLSAVQKLIHQDKVKYIIDNFGDVYNLAVANTDPNKVLYFPVGFGDETVGTKYKYCFRALGGHFTAATNFLLGKDFVKKGAKTTVVCTVDTEIGHVAAMQYGAAEGMAGLKVFDPIFFGLDTVDFGPVATKIKSLNPDVVDFGVSAGEQVVNLVSALKDAGWKGFIFPGAGINPTTFNNIIKRVGKYFDGAEMLFVDSRDIPVVAKDPVMKEYIKRYQKEYGEFNTEGGMWCTGWFFLLDAIQATQSVDTDVLKDYLANSKKAVLTLAGYSQLFARPDIGQYRTTDGTPASGRGYVKNGKLIYIAQTTVKDQYLATVKLRNLVDVYQKYWDKYGKPNFPKENSVLDFKDLTK